jgi:trehalose synthase
MIDFIEVDEHIKLEDYEKITFLSKAVSEMKERAASLLPSLKGRTIWMINSTGQGGGVAEMLPKLISLSCDLGLDVRWAVIGADQKEFFSLTKNIHNLIHDSGRMTLGEKEREIYEAINRKNADALKPHLKPGDILVVHDPQPMALGHMLKGEMEDLHAIWRCHIGVATDTDRTRHAWEFLCPYADRYEETVFTAPEYVPGYLNEKYRIIHPAIDPMNHKNRDLEPVKMTGIMCNSLLAKSHQPVLTPPFDHPVRRMEADGGFSPAVNSTEIGLLYRPIVTQVSRWDRLKGFTPLLQGFAEMKRRVGERLESEWESPRHKRRMEIVRLVLAGPDPDSIQDDPEGLEVMEELKEVYTSLPEMVQRDIAILALPMASRKENALIVNALQRASSLVVQNSLQEGFGLTATEAMWKRKPVLASNATGLREQIDDDIDGCINFDPEDVGGLADQLESILHSPMHRERLAKNAQRKVYGKFLVFTQVTDWLQTLRDVVEDRPSS